MPSSILNQIHSCFSKLALHDAYAKSLRAWFRPAFLGQHQGSVRPIPTLGERILHSLTPFGTLSIHKFSEFENFTFTILYRSSIKVSMGQPTLSGTFSGNATLPSGMRKEANREIGGPRDDVYRLAGFQQNWRTPVPVTRPTPGCRHSLGTGVSVLLEARNAPNAPRSCAAHDLRRPIAPQPRSGQNCA
jgi:hypothetical protein